MLSLPYIILKLHSSFGHDYFLLRGIIMDTTAYVNTDYELNQVGTATTRSSCNMDPNGFQKDSEYITPDACYCFN